MLLTVKDMRNKRAHDEPITARDAYRFTDTVQQFFELTIYSDVTAIFNSHRLAALELLVEEEQEKHKQIVNSSQHHHH